MLVFLPGYLAASVFWRNTPRLQPTDITFALQTLMWAAVLHVLALPITIPAVRLLVADPLSHADDPIVIRAGVALLLGAPVLGLALAWVSRAELGARALAWIGFSVSAQMPTAWDWAFRPGAPGSWIAVHIKGLPDPILGMFGSASLAGSTPAPHDLYVQERWEIVEGRFQRVPLSAGVVFAAGQIEFVEFFSA
jgi:hypothetical protein